MYSLLMVIGVSAGIWAAISLLLAAFSKNRRAKLRPAGIAASVFIATSFLGAMARPVDSGQQQAETVEVAPQKTLRQVAQARKPVTKGELLYRSAVNETSRCAKKHIGRRDSGPDTEIWIRCVQIAADRIRRHPIQVANQVILREGRNVFEAGAGLELSAAAIAQIERGAGTHLRYR